MLKSLGPVGHSINELAMQSTSKIIHSVSKEHGILNVNQFPNIKGPTNQHTLKLGNSITGSNDSLIP